MSEILLIKEKVRKLIDVYKKRLITKNMIWKVRKKVRKVLNEYPKMDPTAKEEMENLLMSEIFKKENRSSNVNKDKKDKQDEIKDDKSGDGEIREESKEHSAIQA